MNKGNLSPNRAFLNFEGNVQTEDASTSAVSSQTYRNFQQQKSLQSKTQTIAPTEREKPSDTTPINVFDELFGEEKGLFSLKRIFNFIFSPAKKDEGKHKKEQENASETDKQRAFKIWQTIKELDQKTVKKIQEAYKQELLRRVSLEQERQNLKVKKKQEEIEKQQWLENYYESAKDSDKGVEGIIGRKTKFNKLQKNY